MASDLKKERDELQQELYRATENVKGLEETLKSVRALSDNRAQKLNAVESTSYKLREEIAELNSNIDNLNETYDDLLERFNAREEDFQRDQKRADIEKNRADKNYEMCNENRKTIFKQKSRIFELENKVDSLNKTLIGAMSRNPFPHASWEAAYNVEREQKIQAYKDVEALKWENEDLKNSCAKHERYEKTITDLRKLADTYYNELVERGNKIDDYEKRIIDLSESGQQKTKLIEELNKRIDGLEMDLRIATNDRERWKKYYNDCGQSLELWKKKHSDLMQNNQIAFAQVNDLQANIASLQKRFDIEHFNLKAATDALDTTQYNRDIWRNNYGRCETARKRLLDKVIELEEEINRLSRFEPLEQEELKELEQLRVDYEAVKRNFEYQEKLNKAMHIDRENEHNNYVQLRDKYDKLIDELEKIRNYYQE